MLLQAPRLVWPPLHTAQHSTAQERSVRPWAQQIRDASIHHNNTQLSSYATSTTRAPLAANDNQAPGTSRYMAWPSGPCAGERSTGRPKPSMHSPANWALLIAFAFNNTSALGEDG